MWIPAARAARPREGHLPQPCLPQCRLPQSAPASLGRPASSAALQSARKAAPTPAACWRAPRGAAKRACAGRAGGRCAASGSGPRRRAAGRTGDHGARLPGQREALLPAGHARALRHAPVCRGAAVLPLAPLPHAALPAPLRAAVPSARTHAHSARAAAAKRRTPARRSPSDTSRSTRAACRPRPCRTGTWAVSSWPGPV